jgi:hypothetical protein
MSTNGINFLDLLNTDITKLLASKKSAPKDKIALDKKWMDRKFERYYPPIGSSKLECQLLIDNGFDILAVLWNFSEAGACFQSIIDPRPYLNKKVTLKINNSGRNKSLCADAIVRWADRITPNLFFTGVALDCDPSLIRESFLSTYLA